MGYSVSNTTTFFRPPNAITFHSRARASVVLFEGPPGSMETRHSDTRGNGELCFRIVFPLFSLSSSVMTQVQFTKGEGRGTGLFLRVSFATV